MNKKNSYNEYMNFSVQMAKRNLIKIILLLIVACQISCDSSGTDSFEKSAYLIDVTKPYTTDSLLSPRELFTDVEYIKLGSPEKFFLTEAKKILELDKKLFILDKNKKVIVAYDLQGNFIGQVGKKGLGPKEYQSVMDFVVDPQRNRLLIFSSADQAILEFDSNLSFRRKIRFNIFASQMSLLSSGNIAFYTYFDHGGSNILVYSPEGEHIDSKMPYPSNGNYTPMDFTGFIAGDYYTYPLSGIIFRLEEDRDDDSGMFEIIIPNMWPENKKFEHTEFLRTTLPERNILCKFTIGKDADELLFNYQYEENGYIGYALGVKLSSGQVYGHLNLKHGFGSRSDQFVRLFFVSPYALPTYSEASGYYYTVATNERMEEFYENRDPALNEIKQIDYNLYKILKESSASDNPVLMRFKLLKEL